MTHTPGPWRLGWGRADYLDIEAYFPDDEAWYAIASIDLDEHGAKPTPEQEANALLLARAPELQAESDRLRGLLRKFEWIPDANCIRKYDWCPVCDQLRGQGHADDCKLAAECNEK